MADDTKNATLRSKIKLGTRVAKEAYGTIVLDSTVEVAAAASAASVYTMARIPTGARINGFSRISFDDLASSGSPTLDVGFKPVDGNFSATGQDDSVNDGIDVSTAAATVNLIKDIANHGKTVWELMGLTADPGGLADLIVTILDAATNTGGTVTLNLMYTTN